MRFALICSQLRPYSLRQRSSGLGVRAHPLDAKPLPRIALPRQFSTG